MTTSHIRPMLAAAFLGWLGMAPRPAAATYIFPTLASFFSNSNLGGGEAPYAGVTLDAQGNLHGTTAFGGANNDGTVFEVAAGTQVLTTVASFTGVNGRNPRGDLIMDAQGNLYGTASAGGANSAGTVFEVAAGTNTITTIATFNTTNGAAPLGNLVMDAQGNLYGTTAFGGSNGLGTVFEISATTHALSTIATFNGANGQGPTGLTMDAQGNIYGTTTLGGAGTQGTAFEISASSHLLSTIATFNTTNGADPMGGLVMDAQGNLYGTTSTAGAGGQGTVFEIAAGTLALSTLATFNVTNGANPVAGLTIDAQGNLYGTTLNGGTGGSGSGPGDGTVFEISAITHALSTLVEFNVTNGAGPAADLTIDAQGNLYGTTTAGGANGGGTVFEVPAGTAAVPEIDPLGVQGGLTLLATGLLILFDRRVRG